MKNETLEDEIKLLKIDFQTFQKNSASEINRLEAIIEKISENTKYLYKRLEIKIPQKKICYECEGHGTVYISPISDCGQPNKCNHCSGKGFNYL